MKIKLLIFGFLLVLFTPKIALGASCFCHTSIGKWNSELGRDIYAKEICYTNVPNEDFCTKTVSGQADAEGYSGGCNFSTTDNCDDKKRDENKKEFQLPQIPQTTKIEEDIKAGKLIELPQERQIKIPGLDFTKVNKVDEQGYLYIPWMAEYITALYKFAIGIISILAVVMIIIQGARIVISGGGEQKTAGYKKILQAVIGLAIAWGSYAILYNINPDLVQFKALKVQYIQPLYLDYASMENTGGDTPGATPEGAGFNNVPVFKQGQSPWGTSPYGDCGGHAGKASYAYSACGATSLAMVLKFYSINADPSIVGDFAIKNGYRKCGNGTDAGIMTTGISKGWPNMKGERVDVKKAIELLKQGKPIILATPSSPQTCYKRGGHYIVATGIDEQGRVRINDPASKCGRDVGGYNGVDGIWAGAKGEGFTAMTQEKFAQAGVGWYVHPK